MINIREYQPATYKDLLKMLIWLQHELNISDYSISLDTGNKPEWVELNDVEGVSLVDNNYMFAKVWIPIEKCKEDDRNPYQILAHEVLHVLTIGAGNINGQKSEFISYRLDDLLYRLYIGTIKKEIMDVKDVVGNKND